jgi:hypothetical protein
MNLLKKMDHRLTMVVVKKVSNGISLRKIFQISQRTMDHGHHLIKIKTIRKMSPAEGQKQKASPILAKTDQLWKIEKQPALHNEVLAGSKEISQLRNPVHHQTMIFRASR